MRDLPESTLVITAVLGLAWSMPSFAYLDPNSGSVLLQIILGGLAGAAVAGRLFWERIKLFFTRKPVAQPSTDENAEEDRGA